MPCDLTTWAIIGVAFTGLAAYAFLVSRLADSYKTQLKQAGEL